MAHINYAGQQHHIPDEEFGRYREEIRQALADDRASELALVDEDGDTSVLFISRGIPVSIHTWDLAMPSDMPPLPPDPASPFI
ncbi:MULTISPECIES: hypothetical protein [Kocuria]|jgi:hypothetical protein|uniref:hypothetical protein n=1 Tax=Kocuria TaxID=57493 RepID=UPI00203A778B|nr:MULTISPECIES: hypothetical protein [Kocuria]MCM3687174.1 hypothetical protein [Kocuria rosea]HST71919.1 hypothetical protein [Kocuria rosea]